MSTVTIKGFIHQSVESWQMGSLIHSTIDDMNSCGYVLVGPCDIEYKMPESFNPIAAQVSSLEKELDKANKAHTDKVIAIKERIANLLCIENKPLQSSDDITF